MVTRCDGVDGDVVKEIRQFRYLVMCWAVRGEWRGQSEQEWPQRGRKWREISRLLVNKDIPLSQRGKVYEACISCVMLYGGDMGLNKETGEYFG
jgi:hypothetical protein